VTGRDSIRIRLLDPATVARIAAGEVIERPASIVKELVENSLDAGAGAIDIEIASAKGQVTRISVTDDGTGMGRTDSGMAFTRHATSKIRDLPDIFTCHTLGFRGEALASIGAVSRTTLITREKGGEGYLGTRIVMEGGQIFEEGDAGCPEGTCITVEKIFFNTPARRKFQKSLASEISLISAIVERLAVTHPDTGFRLTLNGKERIAVPGGSDLRDTIIHLFGLELADQLIPVTGTGRFGVQGFISVPGLSRRNPYQMYISVNRRAVSSRNLNAAIKEAYGTLLPQDRYPVVFLDLSIPGDDVDVNVHPAKKEVRLSGEEEILATVKNVIVATLADQNLVPELKEQRVDVPVTPESRFRYPDPHTVLGAVSESLLKDRLATGRQLRLTETGTAEDTLRLDEPEIIGQLGALYILARTVNGDLLVIDQHAAHERVLYEQVTARSSRPESSQELIDPVIFRVSPRERETLAAAIPVLGEEGFVIEEFGAQDFAVRSVPVVLGRHLDPGVVREIVAELIAPGTTHGPDRTEQLRRIIACRGAIKAGATCTREQCQQLVRQLRNAQNPFTCPHGRPTMIVLPLKKLDELFRRT
jgi:DNA mismatch repair protein MutL